jgi:hypothetical protein
MPGADDVLADPSTASIVRTALAKRIVEMANGDGMTSQKQRDDVIDMFALHTLSDMHACIVCHHDGRGQH